MINEKQLQSELLEARKEILIHRQNNIMLQMSELEKKAEEWGLPLTLKRTNVPAENQGDNHAKVKSANKVGK